MTFDSPPHQTSYDRVPYESHPFPDTHPDRLATQSHLFGLTPPGLSRCRVLELGCASGGNLIPMAVAMPEAEFVGIDLSTVQVAQGQQVIDELGLKNIRLHAQSIADVDASFGTFDYILTHGVFSWVPNDIQEKIFAICAAHLSDNGVAFISYNTLPGWRMRGIVRDAMRFHAMQFDEPGLRVTQARGILDFLAKWVPAENNAYGMLLQSELDTLRRAADYYILHEHLEDINEPIYFHEFAERAGRHGLQYLAEADITTMLASNFPQGVFDTLVKIAPDVIRQEQFMDFLRNRTFRQTLLVRQACRVMRTLTPERVMALWASANLIPVGQGSGLPGQHGKAFQGPKGGVVSTVNPITGVALEILTQHWPGRLPFAELMVRAQARLSGPDAVVPTVAGLSPEAVLASDLLQCHLGGLVELHAGPASFVTEAGSHPQVTPLVRWQAGRGERRVTTGRHEMVFLEERPARLVALLDGSLSREALYAAAGSLDLAGANESRGDPSGTTPRAWVDQVLGQLARLALMRA